MNSEYLQMAAYALLAFAVALFLPAVMALLAGIYEHIRAKRDSDQVEQIVGDWPRVPPPPTEDHR